MGAYRNFRVIKFKEGDFNLTRIPYQYEPSNNDKIHIISDGDRLDTLAFKYYGDSKLWFIIADTNNVINPFELKTGNKLIIPGNV